MQEPLLTDLLPQGWSLDDTGIVSSPGAPSPAQLLAQDIITMLPNYGVLGVAGPEAATFLQGQLSCDVQTLSTARSCRGVHATPKGRAIASFQLLQHDEEQFYFILPTSTLPMLQQSLQKYIVFSKAELTDHSAAWTALAISGPGATALLRDKFGAGTDGAGDQAAVGGGHCIRLEGAGARYLLLLPDSEVAPFWQGAIETLTPADSATHLLQDIQAGVATIEAATSEAFIPQMLNYDKLGAISFNKGCYTGQEVIARAHYRGAVKRRLRGFQLASSSCPAPGAEARSGGKAVGQVANAVQCDGETVAGLVVVAEDFDGDLEIGQCPSPARTSALHYATDD